MRPIAILLAVVLLLCAACSVRSNDLDNSGRTILAPNGILEWLNLPVAVQSRGVTYFAYQQIDAPSGGLDSVWINSYDHETGALGTPYKLRDYTQSEDFLPTPDEHGSPALALTTDGKLIAAYAKHGGPLYVRISSNPYDTSEWDPESVVEPGNTVSYPQLWRLSDGKLALLYRYRNAPETSSGAIRTSSDGGMTWSERVEVFRETGTACYWQTHALGQEIHAAITPFDYEENRYRDVFHIWSSDGGTTWMDTAGQSIALPTTRETASPIVIDDSDQWTWVFDLKLAGSGNPRVIYYDNLGGYGDSARVPNVWYARLVDGEWVASPVDQGASFWSGRGTYPAGAVIDFDDPYRIMMAQGANGTSPDDTDVNPLNNTDATTRIVEYTSADGGDTWIRGEALSETTEGFDVRPQSVLDGQDDLKFIWANITRYPNFRDWESSLHGASWQPSDSAPSD